MQIVFINKCKSCEINNQIFFNVIFSIFENERQTCYYINIVKKKYLVVLFRMVHLMNQMRI